jgi:hypothetical protein
MVLRLTFPPLNYLLILITQTQSQLWASTLNGYSYLYTYILCGASYYPARYSPPSFNVPVVKLIVIHFYEFLLHWTPCHHPTTVSTLYRKN